MGPFWSTRILCGRGATLHAVRPTRSDGTALRATAKWPLFDIKELSSLTYPQKMARAITEVRLRHDTLPSDFRVPFQQQVRRSGKAAPVPSSRNGQRLPSRRTVRFILCARAHAGDQAHILTARDGSNGCAGGPDIERIHRWLDQIERGSAA